MLRYPSELPSHDLPVINRFRYGSNNPNFHRKYRSNSRYGLRLEAFAVKIL